MHGRIDVGEFPLIGGKLPVGCMSTAEDQDELALGEFRVIKASVTQ